MAERISALVTFLAGAAYLILALRIDDAAVGDPWGPRLLPVLVGACITLLALIWFWQTRKQTERVEIWGGGWALALVVAITILYAVIFDPLGYIVATAVALFALLAVFNPRRWLMNTAIAILNSGITYLIFHTLLGVYLPKGIIG